jgi:predicted ATPase
MRPELPTGTVTFLFTDVEGSTKLLEEIGDDAYDAALAEHRRIIREACAEQAGVEVDTQGDAFFFAFPTAPGALAAASAMTHALAPGPIQVRIGLHTGRPRVTDEGYVGKEVHFAARVAATGHGGQIVLSKATADLVEADLTELGEQRLKDVPDAVPVYQLGSGSFPPLKTISNTNLPRPASSFVGRESELAHVLARIEQGARLLTLTGPGGSGKTRLALEAASTLVPEYKAGVFWVGLASLRDPALVTETIAQTLGAKDGLAEHIGEREMLLLLDNLEQVVEAAPELASLVEACPNLALLVTSRELLTVRGEVEYPVPPLASPEAVALFCERSALELSEEIAELCARLDNLPLAVELAAARTRALTVAQILERLSQRLDLLKGGRDADPRQQTLRATIEWSYELLSPEEQALFARLSVFAGGCALEAAEEIAEADLDTLQSLIEKSLVRFTASEAGSRYWMLETIREYAAGQLAAQGDAAVFEQRHRQYFLTVGEQSEEGLWAGQHEASERLESDSENLRAALGSAREDGDVETMLRLAVSIYRFWEVRSRYSEARVWLSQALALDGGDPVLRAKALMGVGRAAGMQCDWDDSIGALERSAESFRDRHDPVGISRCLGFLGHSYLFTGDTGRAAEVLEENLAIARQTDNVQEVARALYNLAFAHVERREFRRARELLEEARRVFDSVPSKYGLALATVNLGNVATLAGDYERAALELEAGLRLAEEMGSPTWVVIARRYLARLALLEGRIDEAEGLLTGLGERRDEVAAQEVAHWLDTFAAVAAASEDAPRAGRLWGAADAAFEALGIVLLEENRLLRGRFMPAAREALGDASWGSAWAEGREMSTSDAIVWAIEQAPAPSSAHST